MTEKMEIAKSWLELLLANQVLMSGVFGWFSAQTIKTVIYAVVNKKLDLTRFVGDGGMPSAHSATVVCMTTSAAIVSGLDSPVFAVAAILCAITMRDAVGVRRVTGKQSQLLNQLIEIFAPANELMPEQRLKEFVGHTPLQVLLGAVLGVLMAFVLDMIYQIRV